MVGVIMEWIYREMKGYSVELIENEQMKINFDD